MNPAESSKLDSRQMQIFLTTSLEFLVAGTDRSIFNIDCNAGVGSSLVACIWKIFYASEGLLSVCCYQRF